MAKKPTDKDALNDQQERFCLEYLKDLNGKQAAIRAGYSEASAESQASRLLSNAKVASRVAELKAKQFGQIELSAARVLQELARLAMVDLSEAYDENGRLKSMKEIPEEVRRAIAGVEVFEEFEGRGEDRVKVGDTVKVKLFDKTRALELLAKHFKLLTDKVDLNVRVTLEDLVAGNQPSKGNTPKEE
jgi:phage terminase small subunit